MTVPEKIAISIPREQLSQMKAAVRRGAATSVSAYVAQALARRNAEDTLAALVADLVAKHAAPSTKDEAWAARVLGKKSRA